MDEREAFERAGCQVGVKYSKWPVGTPRHRRGPKYRKQVKEYCGLIAWRLHEKQAKDWTKETIGVIAEYHETEGDEQARAAVQEAWGIVSRRENEKEIRAIAEKLLESHAQK